MHFNKTMVERAREFYSNVGLGNMEFNGFTVNPGWGMCSQLTRYALLSHNLPDGEKYAEEYGNIVQAISRFTKRWYLYSGNEDYPVPGGIAEYAYNSTEHTMYVGEYGEFRKELARYLYRNMASLIYSNATESGLWAITQYKLRRVLEQAVRGEADDCLGLCCLMGNVVHPHQRLALGKWKEACFVTWPEFSGDIHYPVPSPYEDYTARDMYCGNLHKYSGEYGQRRINLALHLLDNLDF